MGTVVARLRDQKHNLDLPVAPTAPSRYPLQMRLTGPPPRVVGGCATRKWALAASDSMFPSGRPWPPPSLLCAPERLRLVLGLLLAAAERPSVHCSVPV